MYLIMGWFANVSKYYLILIQVQAALSALLAVSVLYVEKNQNKHNKLFQFGQFDALANQLIMRYIQH